MRILITGANGFLGYYLVQQLLAKGHEVIATGRGKRRLPPELGAGLIYESMDFTDPYRVHDVFERYAPEVVIHAGAMTKPDECEDNQWKAYVTNVEGTLNVLLNAEEYHSFFVFLSTDFVFDGEKGMYKEDDVRSPVNFYGKTKMEAEDAVMEYPHDHAIVRTVLVYGKPQVGRQNIITVVKTKLEKGEEYSVVDDQVRTPTFVEDLARGIISIVERKAFGTFHISGKDVMTPYQMAVRTAEMLGLNASLLKRVDSASFSQPAKRPARTGFDLGKARRELGFEPVSFEEGLRLTLDVEGSH